MKRLLTLLVAVTAVLALAIGAGVVRAEGGDDGSGEHSTPTTTTEPCAPGARDDRFARMSEDGTEGDDDLQGDSGDDDLNGDPGDDDLSGGQGDDDIDGGPGAHGVVGGAGGDERVGGEGNDRVPDDR